MAAANQRVRTSFAKTEFQKETRKSSRKPHGISNLGEQVYIETRQMWTANDNGLTWLATSQESMPERMHLEPFEPIARRETERARLEVAFVCRDGHVCFQKHLAARGVEYGKWPEPDSNFLNPLEEARLRKGPIQWGNSWI